MMIYQIYANVMVMIFFSRPRDGDDDISNIRNCGGDDDITNIFFFLASSAKSIFIQETLDSIAASLFV